jgi:RimJ/RimL family protein N-acetyltransferase
MFDHMTFREPTIDDAQMILDWRTADHVAPYMLTVVEYDLDKQRAWIERSNARADYHHRLILIHGRPVGYTSITIVDMDKRIGEIGIYMGERGVPGDLTMYNFVPTLNHAFFALRLTKLVNHIADWNPRVIKVQKYNGYRQIGVEPGKIVKDGIARDLYVFEQTAQEWAQFRRKYPDNRDWDGVARPDPLPVTD